MSTYLSNFHSFAHVDLLEGGKQGICILRLLEPLANLDSQLRQGLCLGFSLSWCTRREDAWSLGFGCRFFFLIVFCWSFVCFGWVSFWCLSFCLWLLSLFCWLLSFLCWLIGWGLVCSWLGFRLGFSRSLSIHVDIEEGFAYCKILASLCMEFRNDSCLWCLNLDTDLVCLDDCHCLINFDGITNL